MSPRFDPIYVITALLLFPVSALGVYIGLHFIANRAIDIAIPKAAAPAGSGSQINPHKATATNLPNEYKSPYGYTINYPVSWSYFTCLNNNQVFFEDAVGSYSPSVCDFPNDFGPLTIIGPETSNDLNNTLQTPTNQYVRTYYTHDLKVEEYTWYSEPPSQNQMVGDLLYASDDKVFQVIYHADDATNTTAVQQMIESFTLTASSS